MKRILLVLALAALFLLGCSSQENSLTGQATHPTYGAFSAPEGRLFLSGSQLFVNDVAVYKTGWYSVNGAAWQSFILSGSAYGASTSWLSGSASASLPSALSAPGEHYLIVYSCSTPGSWNCHDNLWQLRVITIMPAGDAGAADSPLLAGVPLIHDQTFLIPENAVVGDTVGDLNLMWVSPDQNMEFSLVDDDGGRFRLQRLSGRSCVSNHNLNYEVRLSVANAALDYDAQPRRELTVRAVDQATGEYRDATITVKLSKTETTAFIDPSWTGCQTGTRSCPYVSWRNISGANCIGRITPGWTYLQKRGSVYYGTLSDSSGFCSRVTGTPSQHITMGAYGTGDRPVFDGKDILPETVWWYEWSGAIVFGSDSGRGKPISYHDVYSLALTNWWGGILVGNEGTNQSTFTDIHISHMRGLGTFIKSNESDDGQNDLKRVYSSFNDCYSEYTGYPREEANPINLYGFKTGAAAAVNFTYCVARFNKRVGFSGAGNSNNAYRYSQSFSNGHYGIKAQGNNLILDHLLIYNHSLFGIKVGIDPDYEGFTTKNLRITNSIIRDNHYDGSFDANSGNGIYIGQVTSDSIIENNEFSNNDQAITFYNTPSNFLIRNNTFHDNNRSIRAGFWNGLPCTRNITISHNLFYDNKGCSIYLPDASDIKIYHNVFYNNTDRSGYPYDIYMRLDEPLIVRNNLLEDGLSRRLSLHVVDHNLNRSDSFFVDVAARDFRLAPDSPAIDAGANVGLPYQGAAPDIGAFEYAGSASAPSCEDGVRNGEETAVDCGGPSCGACSTFTRTFYVSTTGDDSKDGRTRATAWKTIAKVNSQPYQPGDAILFRRGDIWTIGAGGYLHTDFDGTSGNPITFGAYGVGAKPVLTGFITITGWKDEGNGIFSKTVPCEANPDVETFVVTLDGVNTPMGRYPQTGWMAYESTGTTEISITDNELPASPDWTGAEAVIRKSSNAWMTDRNTITSHTGHTLRYTPGSNWPPVPGFGYFIQRDLRTLTYPGAWYYDDATSKFSMYFGPAGPAGHEVKLATANYPLLLYYNSYHVIDGLSFVGFNNFGILNRGSDHIVVKNNDVRFIGVHGLHVWPYDGGASYLTFENNSVRDASSGIEIRGDGNHMLVRNNTIRDIGLIQGGCPLYTGDNWGDGIALFHADSIVEYNNVTRVGHSGIRFHAGDNIIVRNNHVDGFGLTRYDAGGIYAWNDGNYDPDNQKILNNIVLNGNPVSSGFKGPDDLAVWGIYLDLYDTDTNIEIAGNTVAHCPTAGLLIYLSTNVIARNNTFYDNGDQLQLSNMYGTTPITGCAIGNNTFFAKEADQMALQFSSLVDDFAGFGTADDNYYARPIDDRYTFNTELDYGWISTNYTLAGWKTLSGQDAHSHKSPKAITDVNDIRFEYNPTRTARSVTLVGSYVDVANKTYAGTVTLQPFTSIILIKK